MRGKVIIIDGISNSGKTNSCYNLLTSNDVLIENTTLYAEKFGIILPSPSKKFEEEKRNQNIILNIEINRLKDALKLITSGQNAILDGSFISVVAKSFSDDKARLLPGIYENGIELLKVYLSKIDEMFEKGDVTFIFLDVNQDIYAERNLKRRIPLSGDQADEKLISLQRQFFMITGQEFKSDLIDTSNLRVEDINNIIRNKIGGISM